MKCLLPLACQTYLSCLLVQGKAFFGKLLVSTAGCNEMFSEIVPLDFCDKIKLLRVLCQPLNLKGILHGTVLCRIVCMCSPVVEIPNHGAGLRILFPVLTQL